jgi:8-oxo-dGTP pyrophosphatase MutT (NUDIX family)
VKGNVAKEERVPLEAAVGERLSRASIRAALRPTPPPLSASEAGLRPAAVLFPIVERSVPSALFTRRTDDLPSHAGQICFPGGKYHPGDQTLIRTALREVEEEIGLSPSDVEVAGYLDSYETQNTGFTILPVVGFLLADYRLTIDPREVAEVFEAPLPYILDPKNQALKSLERGGVMRQFYAIEFNGHTIWGATAAMIVNLSERLGFR